MDTELIKGLAGPGATTILFAAFLFILVPRVTRDVKSFVNDLVTNFRNEMAAERTGHREEIKSITDGLEGIEKAQQKQTVVLAGLEKETQRQTRELERQTAELSGLRQDLSGDIDRDTKE